MQPRATDPEGPLDTIINMLPGGRGRAFTFVINQAGLSTSPQGLQQAYRQNPQAIDHYLNYIDGDAILNDIMSDQEAPFFSAQWFLLRSPALLIGAAVGAVGVYTFSKLKSN